MKRIDLISKYFQRKDKLSVKNKDYQKQINELFLWLIKADDVYNDKTKTLFTTNQKTNAKIIAKQKGIIAGLEEIIFLIKNNTELIISKEVNDGDFVKENTVILKISGKASKILAFERTILNIMGRMSGIATKTNKLISLCHPNLTPGKPLLAATRKTPWMTLDKKAVAVAGGLTHRLNLLDWPLIKDNHLKLKTVEKVIQSIPSSLDFFEIEVDTENQAEKAIKAYKEKLKKNKKLVMGLLFDNFKTERLNKYLLNLKKESICTNILTEASGGINEENILNFAKTGVDIISLGSLTHSSKTFDLSLEVI